LPTRGNMLEFDLAFLGASIVRIQQNLGEIEKCMLRIECRAVRTRVIHEHLIIDPRTLASSSHPPATLIQLRQPNGMALEIGGPDGIDVLGKIAYLVKRVPDRELDVLGVRPRWKLHGDLDQMTNWIGQVDRVANHSLQCMAR